MRIGIMLRHLNQHNGGVIVYTHNLLRQMLALNTAHEFVLLYQDRRLVGIYSDGVRVREIAIEAPSIFLWDQLAVRWAEKREKLDLIFNLKYSVPLMAKCPTVFVCHGLDWYVMPWGSRWSDRLSHKYLIPRYARKADAIISISNTVRDHVIEYLGVDGNRVHTVYSGVEESFLRPISQRRLEDVRRLHRLPDRFFFYCGQIYPPKNFGRLLQAYAQVGPKLGISLVVAGEHRWLSQGDLALVDRLGIRSWIVWSGWIDHDTIPAFYTLAEALIFPSLYEGFGLPIIEAMACGTPVVTANRYATKELADGAGVLVDPEDVSSIADGMRRVTTDRDLHHRLIEAGRKRVHEFNWKKCAEETLRVLEDAAMRSR